MSHSASQRSMGTNTVGTRRSSFQTTYEMKDDDEWGNDRYNKHERKKSYEHSPLILVRPKYEEEDSLSLRHRPSNLKTSTTVLVDEDKGIQYSSGDELNEFDERHESSDSSSAEANSGRYGSPGVTPGMYTNKSAYARPTARRRAPSDNTVKNSRGKMVDAVTQTLNDASTQTALGKEEILDDTEDIISPGRSAPITISPSAPKRPPLAMPQTQAHHRRSVSWDPPSIIAGDPKTKSQGMLNMLMKEKREALLQKEAELRRENEIRKELEQQQRQQKLLRDAMVSKMSPPVTASPPQITVAVSSPLATSPNLVPPSILLSPTHSTLSPSHSLSPSHAMSPAHSNLSASHTLSPSMAMGTPSSSTLAPRSHTRVNAHHHRSKSDPNVIPLLMKGLRVGPNGTPTLPGGISLAAAAAAHQPRSPKAHPENAHVLPQHNGSPYLAPRVYHTLHRPTSSSKLASASPSPSSSPTRDKQRELMELEMRVEMKQKQLMDKGILPSSSSHYVGGDHRRREWSLEDGLSHHQLISNQLLEDIEEEIEAIRQRTMDIQDKVELLERVRCAAPDPVLMMFGDNMRPSQPKRASPPYSLFSPITKNDNYSSTALRPRLSKYAQPPSPTPHGPDRTKARNLMSPSSAFFAPPSRSTSSEDVTAAAGSGFRIYEKM